jgi:hypothetical protein
VFLQALREQDLLSGRAPAAPGQSGRFWTKLKVANHLRGAARWRARRALQLTAAARRHAVVIERWTTDAERDRLRATLMEKGSSALRTALRDITPRAGYLRGTVTLGWNLRFARELPLPEGGRRIVIATDRSMCFWELWRRPPSADCEFKLAEIRLGPDGRGEGKLATAAKVIWNDVSRTIEIENYAFEPAHLDEVRVTDGR